MSIRPMGPSQAGLAGAYTTVFKPESYDALGLGAAGTDWTAAILAADAASVAAGGPLVFTPGKTYLCLGAVAPAFAAGGGFPTQANRRWTSAGGPTWSGYWTSPDLTTSAVLDLRYDGTDGLHPAKIDTRGAGFFEIDHLSIISGGTDNFPIFQTTNTTVFAHHNYVRGNTANSGSSCAQDGFILGGTGTATSTAATGWFQGYGTVVSDNFFDHIRTGVRGQSAFNSCPIERNTFSLTCGSAGSYAAIELIGGSGNAGCSGNAVRDNTIEVAHYVYGVRLVNAVNNTIGPNGYWDALAGHLAGVLCSTGASRNKIVEGLTSPSFVLLSEDPTVKELNEIDSPTDGLQAARHVFVHDYMGAPPARYFVQAASTPGPFFVDLAGNVAHWSVITSAGTVTGLQQVTRMAPSFTDGATTSGSTTFTSATAAFVNSDVGCVLAGTGIPARTRIVRRNSATSVELSQAATATATGVTFTVGGNLTRNSTAVNGVFVENGHMRPPSTGTAGGMSLSAQAAAGTGRSASIDTNAADEVGTLTLVTGTGPTTGTLVNIGTAKPFARSPYVILSPANAAAAAAMTSVYAEGYTISNWRVVAGVALPASTTFLWTYRVMSTT